MQKEEIVKYLLIGIITITLIGVLLIFRGGFTGYAVFEDSGTDFDLGTYSNTTYNGSGIVLDGGNLTGDYVSQVFDAGADSRWNNLTYQSTQPDAEFLFAVDGAGDVYKSNDGGVNWIQVADNYGRTTDTEELVADSEYIYIFTASNKEVWRSGDLGVSWSVVNNTFTTNGLREGAYDDSTGLIYISTGPGIVYSSNNFGVSWTELGDINLDKSEDPKGIDTNSTGAVFAVDGKGRVELSLNYGTTWIEQTDAYGGGSATDDLAVDSDGNIYILLNRQVYKSIDKGVTWNIINNSYSSDQDGLLMIVDKNNIFYIVDPSGDVYKSTNSGVAWDWISDFNGAATNNIKGLDDFSQSTNLSFEIRNCSLSDCSDGIWQTADLNDLNLTGRYFQYKVLFTTPDSSTTPSLNSVNIDYTILNTAPSISITSPQDGNSYGYNESINFNFTTSDSENNLDSCWYSLDSQQNISISNCQNTTFDVSEGSHTLIAYVNDTNNEQASDSVSFTVQVGSPTITSLFPINNYLNYRNVQFNYTPTDTDLSSCELWGDFDGEFKLNQSDNSPISGQINSFLLNLLEGTYLWNIRCNDTMGNSAFNGNKTFYIDTTNPQVVLTQPTGEKTSRTITANWIIVDSSPTSCIYNVYRGANIEVVNTSVDCSTNSVSFEVTVDASFTFNFYVNDSAGNANLTGSNFLVDTSTTPPSSGGGSGGGGGEGRGTTTLSPLGKLETSSIEEIIARSGDKKILFLNVKNAGRTFLNNCRLKISGDISSLFYSNQLQGLAPGESSNFVFNLNIPENAEESYSGDLEISCDELAESQSINLKIPRENGLIEIKEIKQEKDGLRVNYVFKGTGETDVEIWILDEQETEIKRYVDTVNGGTEKSILIELPDNLVGIYYIYMALSSDKENYIKQSVVLGKVSTTGQAIFGEGGKKITGYLVFIIIVGVIIFFSIKMSREKKTSKLKKRKNKK